jgi:hypothetical protein
MVPAAHRDTKPTTFDRPLCYLPMNVDNSSGGQGWVAGDKWGPFAGQLLHSSYGMCTFFVMMHETINGVTHGAAVKLPLQTVKGHAFQSGIMRIRQSPTDGQIWVCGMRGWQTNAKQTGALQRVRWTGKPANLPKRFHVTKTGVEITFTDPLDPATAGAAENYALEQWNYQWTQNYGSPETKPSDGKNGHDKIDLTSVNLSADHRTVTLTFADLKPVDQLKIKYRLKGADGRTADNEIYATINAVP